MGGTGLEAAVIKCLFDPRHRRFFIFIWVYLLFRKVFKTD